MQTEKSHQQTIDWINEGISTNTRICTKNNPDILYALLQQNYNYKFTMENMTNEVRNDS